MVLEILFKDTGNNELSKITKTFAKKFSLVPVLGLMPYKLIENTQPQSGEKRHLTFALSSDLNGKISNVEITLKMFEVSDEYQGDIKKAYWISQPIFKEVINFEEINQVNGI